MSLFRRSPSVSTEPAAGRLAQVSTGWLQSPYGQRAAVCITREIDRLIVLHIYVASDRQPIRAPVYEGRSTREATKAANDLLQTLRLRGYKAIHPASSDASFSVEDVCRTLDVALG